MLMSLSKHKYNNKYRKGRKGNSFLAKVELEGWEGEKAKVLADSKAEL